MRKYSFVAIVAALLFFVAFIGYINYKSVEESFVQRFVEQASMDVRNEVENKKQFNLALAVVLAHSKEIQEWLQSKEGELSLEKIARSLRQNTVYQNIWFKILDERYQILYSTAPRYKYKRFEVSKIERDFFSDLIVDCYGLHISAFGRVKKDARTLGYVEVLSQFNTIRKNLRQEGIVALTLLDKKFIHKARLAQKRIGDYAIMDDTYDMKLFELIGRVGIEKILKSPRPVRVEEYVLYRVALKNAKGEIVGWIVYCKNMADIFDQFLSKNILIRILILAFIVAAAFWIFAYYYQKERKRLLNEKIAYYSKILDRLHEIVIITDGERIKFANASFFRYLDEYENIEQFLKEHNCICDFFVEEEGFLHAWMGDRNWVEYLIDHPDEAHYAKIRYKNKEYIFQVKANKIDDKDYVVIFIDVTENYFRQERLRKLAIRDPLTGLYNRYVFDKIAAEKIEEAKILGDELLFVMFDIDHFKKINDKYGHDTGDYVLKTIASMIQSSFRSTDPVFRIGGEEFIAVLVTSDIYKILEILEDLRKKVERTRFEGVEEGVTISIGVAQYRKGDSVKSLYKRVDKALYMSKNKGRNTITFLGENDG